LNIRKYLKGYPNINDEIQRLQKELNFFIKCKHESYCTLKAIPADMSKVKVSGISDQVYASVQVIVDRYDKKIEYYTDQINRILDEKALFEMIWFSDILSNEDRAIIQYRCFEHLKWPEIARIMKYSKRQCQRHLDDVIDKIQCEVDKLIGEKQM